jgi:DNA-binding NarL/FixJ family response regulator
MSPPVRIVLADDHPIVLEGLKNLILADPDLALVGEATSGLTALKTIQNTSPDVAVVDISMPELNGIALARRLAEHCPGVKVLLLTLHEERAYINQAFEAGVRGYALKRTAASHLLSAIRAVQVGGLYLDPAIGDGPARGRAPASEVSAAPPTHPRLANREIEVLKLAALGYTNKEIANQLDVSVKSVETYKARAAEKLGLTSRADIVRYAAGQGWLSDA